MIFSEELLRRAGEYAAANALLLGNELGRGVRGIDFVAKTHGGTARSAVKIHGRQEAYCRERNVYLRLRERGVQRIRGCEVPQLVRYDDERWVIEMTIVSPPFLLDFAAAYLDQPLPFSDEVMAEWHEQKREQFGKRWPEVEAILRELESHGIYQDVSPRNITLGH
jgi:hypothetical protein